MKWSILVLTQASRARFLARLKACLRPQLEEQPDVELLIHEFNNEMDLGTNRQNLLSSSGAQYVNFIDDDDLVPADYVSTIFPLLDGIDYIGHRVQMFIDGAKQIPTFHSLRYKEWSGDKDGWYRDISHVNPIRRDLAMQAAMSGGFGEDHRWAQALRAKGIVKTEHYVDAVMYFYYFRTVKDDPNPRPGSPSTTAPQLVRSPICPKCGSTATCLAGGMRHCNQCGHRWV